MTKLPEETREAMWAVFSRFYEATTKPVFERDLAEKNHVIILRDEGDRSLRGFSTLKVYRRTHAGRPCVAVFSGDTVLEPAYWGQTALPIAFFRYLMSTKLRAINIPVYWFLLSKGYRTYLTMSRNLVHYWPRHEEETPPWEQSLIDFLARDKFGEAYQADRGVVSFATPEGYLRPEVAPIQPELLNQRDVAFFVERNPGHAQGEELCCLGSVDFALVVSFTSKHLRRAWARLQKRARRRWASENASS